MEINTQQLEALFHLQEQQAQMPRKTQAQGEGFESLLNSQLAGKTEVTPENPVLLDAQAIMYAPLVNSPTNDSAAVDPDEAAILAAFDQASGTLDLWDRYARTLGTSPADTALREAWNLLEGIDSNISQMRSNPLSSSNGALKAILNDLEVMSATEKFKFNRGDYLA